MEQPNQLNLDADGVYDASKEKKLTPEDISKTKDRLLEVARGYMDEVEGGYLLKMNETLENNEVQLLAEMKAEALEDLDGQMTVINSLETSELDEAKNKIQAVIDFYEKRF